MLNSATLTLRWVRAYAYGYGSIRYRAIRARRVGNLLRTLGAWLVADGLMTLRGQRVRIRRDRTGRFRLVPHPSRMFIDVYFDDMMIGTVCSDQWRRITGLGGRGRFTVTRMRPR